MIERVLLVVCVFGMLQFSERFQSMSRELDNAALSALKRIARAAEESGDHPEIISLLMLLTALLMLSLSLTQGVGQ